jgi:hypothetical protein
MITGVHAVMFSPDAEKVRAFLAGTLGSPCTRATGPAGTSCT